MMEICHTDIVALGLVINICANLHICAGKLPSCRLYHLPVLCGLIPEVSILHCTVVEYHEMTVSSHHL